MRAVKKVQRNSNKRSVAHRGRIQAQIAAEAGRIMVVEGVQDYRQAKLKARDRLRLDKDVPLPSNLEIQLAHENYLTLFTPQEQIPAQRREMMEMAAEAMTFLQHFNPRLVADFLNRPINPDAIIELHLQAQGPESVAHFLREKTIPFEQQEKLVHVGTNNSITAPELHLQVNDQQFRLVIFTDIQFRQTPRDVSGNGAQYRISLKQVAQWLETSQQG